MPNLVNQRYLLASFQARSSISISGSVFIVLVIVGGGGTQRLIRAIGKAKAMEMILTGSMITAAQAERDGLVCRVVPTDKVQKELCYR